MPITLFMEPTRHVLPMTEPAYLLVLARIRDRPAFSAYVNALPPIQAAHGGRSLAVVPGPAVEQFGQPQEAPSVVVSHWPALHRLHEFWQSSDYQNVARLRAGSGEFVVLALPGEQHDPDVDSPSAAALVTVLGHGPSPALLEAEGARLLAHARNGAIEVLEGAWDKGDIALYAFSETEVARRVLMRFSSGQRGRSLLLPALHNGHSHSNGHSAAGIRPALS